MLSHVNSLDDMLDCTMLHLLNEDEADMDLDSMDTESDEDGCVGVLKRTGLWVVRYQRYGRGE